MWPNRKVQLGASALSEYTRPYLYPQQLDAIFCPERYALIEASTKSGKTVGSIAWIVEKAIQGKENYNYWWVAPGYNQAEIAYRRIKNGLTKGAFTAYDTPTPRIKLLNGPVIWFKSADNPDALYGEDVYGAVIDEASRASEASWIAIRSTLTATRGPVRIIGNVKGRKNWFYTLARRAEAMMLSEPNPLKRSMHYAKITADDAVNAGVLAKDEIDDAREVLPDNIFRELYYAEPGDDTGNPFGLSHIAGCTTTDLGSGPVVAWGIDLAKKQDWFVAIGLNELGQVAAFHRWQKTPWPVSINRVRQLVGEDAPALVDSTGLGDPVLEDLQIERGNFSGYMFTPNSKQKLMEGLAVSIQSREISFPKGYISQELETFEYEFTRTGVRYSAPEGFNDDCVCALALARQMWTTVAPGANIMKYYAQTNQKVRAYEATAEAKSDSKPWTTPTTGFNVDVGSILDNELEEVYNETLARELPGINRNCRFCGKPVAGATRVTDGEFFWHTECAGTPNRPRLMAEVVV